MSFPLQSDADCNAFDAPRLMNHPSAFLKNVSINVCSNLVCVKSDVYYRH